VFRQQCLVGGHHILAALEQLKHDRPGGIHPPYQLDGNLNLRIIENILKILAKEVGRQGNIAGPAQILIDYSDQFHLAPHAAGDPVCLLDQQLGGAGTDGAKTDNRDLRRLLWWTRLPFSGANRIRYRRSRGPEPSSAYRADLQDRP
jgi:hypothetical protein